MPSMARSGDGTFGAAGSDARTPLLQKVGRTTGAAAASGSTRGASMFETDLRQTSFNMINCFIGAGILTVPFAFRLAGFGALFGLALVAALNWCTSLLLGRALEKAAILRPEVPASSWDMPALGRVAFGPKGEKAISVLFALELWFALETFIVLTGINVSLVTGLPRTPVIVAAGLLGTSMLGLPMSTIAGFSFLSVWCMAGGFLALCVCGMGAIVDNGVPQHTLVDPWKLPSAVGIFMYCFSGLPCLPNIRASMRRPEEYPKAVNYAFTFAASYYAAVGMLGYFFFGANTSNSFTENLTPANGSRHHAFLASFALLSAGLFAAKLQAGFPLYAAPVLSTLGFGDGGVSVTKEPATIWTGRFIFAVVSVAFAVFAQDALDAVAELMGAFLTNFTSIIFPVCAYVKVVRASGEKLSLGATIGLSMMLVFGIGFGIVGTASACRRFWVEEASSPVMLSFLARHF